MFFLISLCSTALIAYVMIILQHPDHRDSPILFLGKLRGLKIKPFFWERIEAPLPRVRPRPKCNFIHPRQLSPFPERLGLPFSNDEILYEDIVSSGTDHFAAWVKVSPHKVLVQHMVDIQRATTDFREASERRPATSSQTNSVNKHFATRFSAFTTSTLGPDAEKKMPSKKQIAGRWHIITLQEASEYVDHDILTRRFHVTHCAGCAILLMSNPSIIVTQGETCQIKSWKENSDGSCKVFFHVPHCVDHQSAGRSPLQCCLYISATSTPRSKASPRSSFSLFVPS